MVIVSLKARRPITDLPHTPGGKTGRYYASGGHLNLARSGHLNLAALRRLFGSTACLEKIPRNNSAEIPMAADEFIYSREEAVIAQMALRRAAGLAVETLALTAFVDAVRGEIDILRNAGFVDDEIAAIVERAIGRPLAPESIGQCRPRQRALDLSAVSGLESA